MTDDDQLQKISCFATRGVVSFNGAPGHVVGLLFGSRLGVSTVAEAREHAINAKIETIFLIYICVTRRCSENNVTLQFFTKWTTI
jgi:hypothetical protein